MSIVRVEREQTDGGEDQYTVEETPMAPAWAPDASLSVVGTPIPRVEGGDARGALRTIAGQPPDVRELGAGCPFEPRCAYAREGCSEVSMELAAVGAGHLTACPFVRDDEEPQAGSEP